MTPFAAFGISYRYAMWLQRPPTALYWKRGWQIFLRPKYLAQNLRTWVSRVTSEFALNRFIYRRGSTRWAAHFLLMWGCILAIAITFPLVFGWLHFETLPEDLTWYRAYVFGFPTFAFPIHSLFGFLIFLRAGVGVHFGDCGRDDCDAAADARSRGGSQAAVCGRFHATDFVVCDQRDGVDVDGELYVDARLCV
ncbi:MAG: hypothetical protein U0Y68_15870 [Blastocatellia bacterium]